MRVLLTLLFVFTSTIATAQYRLGQPVEVTWDYTLAEVTATGVTNFQVQLDTGPWVNTGLPPNATSYVYVLPSVGLVLGNHVVRVRACNAVPDCSVVAAPGTSISFTVVRTIPAAPTNFKVQPGTVIVSNERILEIARAYTLLFREEPLSENDIIFLAQRYKGPIPVTYESLLSHLDTQLVLLGQ